MEKEVEILATHFRVVDVPLSRHINRETNEYFEEYEESQTEC